MAWIESHEELGDHHKTHKLAKILNCNVATAVGTVHLLWHYTLKISWQFGDISKQSPEAIARGCWFNGEPNLLIAAFQESGFLDGMKIHDWEIYAKELIYQRLYNSMRKDKKNKPVNTAVTTPVVKASTLPYLTLPNHKSFIVQVINHLNHLTGFNYQPKGANADLVSARIKEGYTTEDIISVIDIKYKEWGREQKMKEFLRPKTLFNKTNFSNYIGQIKKLDPSDVWAGARS